jgi:hypothetical protein
MGTHGYFHMGNKAIQWVASPTRRLLQQQSVLNGKADTTLVVGAGTALLRDSEPDLREATKRIDERTLSLRHVEGVPQRGIKLGSVRAADHCMWTCHDKPAHLISIRCLSSSQQYQIQTYFSNPIRRVRPSRYISTQELIRAWSHSSLGVVAI